MNFVEAYKAALEGKLVVNPDFPEFCFSKGEDSNIPEDENGELVSCYIYNCLSESEEIQFITSEKFEVVKEKVKKEGWINIYPNAVFSPCIHKSKEEADKTTTSSRVACIKIEWEE